MFRFRLRDHQRPCPWRAGASSQDPLRYPTIALSNADLVREQTSIRLQNAKKGRDRVVPDRALFAPLYSELQTTPS